MLVKKSFVKIALIFLALLLLNACGSTNDTQPTDLQISSTSASFTISQTSMNLIQSKDYEITWSRQDVVFILIGVLGESFPSWLRIYNSTLTNSPVTTTLEVDATGLNIGTYSVTATIVSNRPNYEEVERISFPLTLIVVP